MRKINQLGIDLIKSFEKCRLMPYLDVGGVWTVGFGATGHDITQNTHFTKEQAEERLKKDLEKFEKICDYIHVELTDNQFSALVCLAFNIGLTAFKNSTALKMVNTHQDPVEAWMRWNKVNGVVVPGLTNRRKAEVELWKKT